MKTLGNLLILATGILFTNVTWGADKTWTGGGSSSYASDAANWAGGRPGTDDTVVLDSTTNKNMIWDAGSNGLPDTVAAWRQTAGYAGTVTIQTVYGATGFTNFTISGDATISGGTLTHKANTTYEGYRLAMTVNGNLTIGTNASIGTLGLGYIAGYGPGSSGGAATHGGVGYGGSYNVYGSIFAPVNLGSGGNNAGGGAIRLIVGGTLTHYGTITASTPTGSSTGAGGSIYITAGAIAGSPTGVIKANGTPDGSSYSGGGGGRVSVILTNAGATFSTYSGGMQAYGGWVGSRSGAAGTVYKETAAQGTGHGTLIIDNAGGYDLATTTVFTLMPTGTDLSVFEQVIIRNNGFLAVTAGSLLDFGTAHIAGHSGAAAHIALLNTNAVIFPNPFAFSNYTLNINVPLVTTGPWTIKSGGCLSHSAGLSLNFTIDGDLTVDAGGQIHADGRNASGGLGASSTTCAYGGLGGDPASMGATYGSIIAPVASGSGAGGGGLITLTVTGTLTNNGTISAAGLGAKTSGGGINIRTGTLKGNGAIQVPGGGGDNSHSGGGGRVAVVLTQEGATFSSYAGSMSAFAGYSGLANRGAAGTVYKAIAGIKTGSGTVLVDNNGFTNVANAACLTPLPAASNSSEILKYSSWTVQNRGKIGLLKDAAILSMRINANSYLELAGHTLTTFYLTITNKIYQPGFYTAAQLGALVLDNSGGTGKVVILAQGTLFIVQ